MRSFLNNTVLVSQVTPYMPIAYYFFHAAVETIVFVSCSILCHTLQWLDTLFDLFSRHYINDE